MITKHLRWQLKKRKGPFCSQILRFSSMLEPLFLGLCWGGMFWWVWIVEEAIYLLFSKDWKRGRGQDPRTFFKGTPLQTGRPPARLHLSSFFCSSLIAPTGWRIKPLTSGSLGGILLQTRVLTWRKVEEPQHSQHAGPTRRMRSGAGMLELWSEGRKEETRPFRTVLTVGTGVQLTRKLSLGDTFTPLELQRVQVIIVPRLALSS